MLIKATAICAAPPFSLPSTITCAHAVPRALA
jgi:hypothetical protein